MFDLDTSKEKSGRYVDDLDLILHHPCVEDKETYAHERLHVQLAHILIVTADATATGSDALSDTCAAVMLDTGSIHQKAEMRPRLGMLVDLESRDHPIFRGVELADGVQIFPDKALSYSKAMGDLLGDSSTYIRYNMPHFTDADAQAIILGSHLQSDLPTAWAGLCDMATLLQSLRPAEARSLQ
ncbi:hypothetical protein DL765_008619 [Monosporascus sp. GIB2]|nr:hypothetical protein DL765_008619 [Monosporascus sp. GIB2]